MSYTTHRLPEYFKLISGDEAVELEILLDLIQQVKKHFSNEQAAKQYIAQDLFRRYNANWSNTHSLLRKEAIWASELRTKILTSQPLSKIINEFINYGKFYQTTLLSNDKVGKVGYSWSEFKKTYQNLSQQERQHLDRYNNLWIFQPYDPLHELIDYYLLLLAIKADFNNFAHLVTALQNRYRWYYFSKPLITSKILQEEYYRRSGVAYLSEEGVLEL